MADHPLDGFALSLRFTGGQAVLSVDGEVDPLTAPTLASVLGALVDHHDSTIALDLTDLEFIGAAGIGVIADTTTTLKASGRMLTLRSPPSLTQRLLAITRVDELVEMDATATLERSSDLAHRVAATQASDKVIDAALRLVTELASTTVEGADGVSVSLERHGRMVTVASSDQTVRRMDTHQYQTGEGPCLAAADEGHLFHSESLAEESRWPAFVPRAINEGIASILSTPLVTADRPLGALNIYSNTARAFGPDQQALAALFANQASGILSDAGIGGLDDQATERIAEALHARTVIAHAEGVLMARGRLAPDEAAATLHRSARSANVPVLQHATEIAASTTDDPTRGLTDLSHG